MDKGLGLVSCKSVPDPTSISLRYMGLADVKI